MDFWPTTKELAKQNALPVEQRNPRRDAVLAHVKAADLAAPTEVCRAMRRARHTGGGQGRTAVAGIDPAGGQSAPVRCLDAAGQSRRYAGGAGNCFCCRLATHCAWGGTEAVGSDAWLYQPL